MFTELLKLCVCALVILSCSGTQTKMSSGQSSSVPSNSPTSDAESDEAAFQGKSDNTSMPSALSSETAVTPSQISGTYLTCHTIADIDSDDGTISVGCSIMEGSLKATVPSSSLIKWSFEPINGLDISYVEEPQESQWHVIFNVKANVPDDSGAGGGTVIFNVEILNEIYTTQVALSNAGSSSVTGTRKIQYESENLVGQCMSLNQALGISKLKMDQCDDSVDVVLASRNQLFDFNPDGSLKATEYCLVKNSANIEAGDCGNAVSWAFLSTGQLQQNQTNQCLDSTLRLVLCNLNDLSQMWKIRNK